MRYFKEYYYIVKRYRKDLDTTLLTFFNNLFGKDLSSQTLSHLIEDTSLTDTEFLSITQSPETYLHKYSSNYNANYKQIDKNKKDRFEKEIKAYSETLPVMFNSKEDHVIATSLLTSLVLDYICNKRNYLKDTVRVPEETKRLLLNKQEKCTNNNERFSMPQAFHLLYNNDTSFKEMLDELDQKYDILPSIEHNIGAFPIKGENNLAEKILSIASLLRCFDVMVFKNTNNHNVSNYDIERALMRCDNSKLIKHLKVKKNISLQMWDEKLLDKEKNQSEEYAYV